MLLKVLELMIAFTEGESLFIEEVSLMSFVATPKRAAPGRCSSQAVRLLSNPTSERQYYAQPARCNVEIKRDGLS